MKKIIILTALVLSTGIFSNINAQAPVVSPPSTSGDKDLRDTNVRSRSVDLERVDRDARKTDKTAAKNPVTENQTATTEDKLAAKYDEIKTDYEQIQLSQDAVVKVYQGVGKIDYAQIGKSAREINKSAARLNLNLFPTIEIPDAKKEPKPENKKEKETTKTARSVRDLIVELDNAIGSFATSPMFQNLRTVDPKVYEKTKLDLEKIIELSTLLDAEARKMDTSEK